MTRPALFLLALASLALGAGCGDPLSNRLLLEDALYRDALPGREDVATEVPGAEDEGARDLGERATFVDATVSVSGLYNGTVFALLAVVDRVVALDVTERSEDRRVWGPYGGGRLGSSVRLVVTRADDALFGYDLQVAEAGPRSVEEEDWRSLMLGVFASGESLVDGEGEFALDLSAWGVVDADFAGWAGVVQVGHGRSEAGVSLDIVVDGLLRGDGSSISAVYTFRGGREEGGFFEYEADDLVNDGSGAQSYIIRSRWLPGGAGRADFVGTGGALGAAVVPGSECWDGGLERVYYRLDPPGTGFDQLEGEETSCGLEEEEPGSPAPALGG